MLRLAEATKTSDISVLYAGGARCIAREGMGQMRERRSHIRLVHKGNVIELHGLHERLSRAVAPRRVHRRVQWLQAKLAGDAARAMVASQHLDEMPKPCARLLDALFWIVLCSKTNHMGKYTWLAVLVSADVSCFGCLQSRCFLAVVVMIQTRFNQAQPAHPLPREPPLRFR